MVVNVRSSTTMVAVLTGAGSSRKDRSRSSSGQYSHYFSSRACMHEMREAIESKQREGKRGELAQRTQL